MGIINTFLSQQLIIMIGWVLVHFLWQACITMALIWCLMKLLARASANSRYLTACLGLLLMALSPAVTFWTMNSSDRVNPSTYSVSQQDVVSSSRVTEVLIQDIVISDNHFTPSEKPIKNTLNGSIESVLPYCVIGWMLGVAGLSLWYLGGWRQVQKLRRIGTVTVSNKIKEKTLDLARQLGIRRAIHIVESVLVQTPTVIGWLKPIILLPASALTGLTEEQLKALIAHELAHIKRYDYLVNIIQTVIEILGFYHPAVWWVSRQIRMERENCCDDIAVALIQNRKDYAGALFTMEAIRSKQHDLAIAASAGHLQNRIRRLTGKSVACPRNGWIPIGVTFGLVVVLISGLAFTSQTPAETAEKILRFPTDESLGDIYIYVDNPEHVHPFNAFHDLAQWQKFANAKGDVRIPAGKRIKLVITSAVGDYPEKLAPLKAFRPDDLYLLQLEPGWSSPKPATDKCIPYIRHLTGLKHLDIGDSAITRQGLEQLSEMQELERIVLPKNLTNGGLGAVVKMKSLKSIRFRDNRVSDKSLSLLAQLPNLKELCLYGEKMTDEGLSYLPQLTRLEYLSLGTATQPFSPQGYAFIAQIPNLRALWIDTGDCTVEKLQPFRQHPTLEKLSLHWEGNITDKGIEVISTIPNLKLLDISSARGVTNLGLGYVGRLRNLDHLELSSSGYTDDGIAQLAGLKNLTFLKSNTASNSPLTDKSMEVISGLSKLQTLWIGGDGVTDQGMQAISNLKNLKELLISTAPQVTDKGIGCLSSCENLETLYWAAKSKNTFAALNQLSNLKKLKRLDVSKIQRGNADLALSGLDNLQTLKIELTRQFDKNNMTSTFTDSFLDEDLACLRGFKKLESLQLCGNGIGDKGLEYLAGLNNLNTIFLYGQLQITDTGIKHLSGLNRLMQLHIHDGHFTDAALDTLGQLEGLEMLELTSDMPFSKSAITNFRERKKNILILKLDANTDNQQSSRSGDYGGGMGGFGGGLVTAALPSPEIVEDGIEKQIAIEARFILAGDDYLKDVGIDASKHVIGQVIEGPANSTQIQAALEPKTLSERELPFDSFDVLDDLQESNLVQATRRYQNAKQLIAPKAMVLNAESASLQVKTEQNYKDIDDREKTIEKGIILDLKPTIQNDSNDMLLEGHVLISDILSSQSQESNGKSYEIPVLEISAIPIHTIVNNRQTILVTGPKLSSSKNGNETTSENSAQPPTERRQLIILIKLTIIPVTEESESEKAQ